MREIFVPITKSVQEAPPDIKDQTLMESLEKRRFPLREKLAIELLDRKKITLENKRLLFFYFLWQETGSFGPIKEFGEIKEDPTIDSMLDKVMEEDKLFNTYESFHREHTYLSENKQSLLVFKLKKEGLKSEEIARILNMTLSRVNSLSSDLAYLDLIDVNPHIRHLVEESRDFTKKVKELRERKIPNTEIAKLLNAPNKKVRNAVRRLLSFDDINLYRPRKIQNQYPEKTEVIREKVKHLRANTSLTRKEIASQLQITEETVAWHISILLKKNEVPQKNDRANRIIKKENLREVLKNFDKDIPVSLWKLKSDYFPKMDLRTIRSLYYEISLEENVPPIATSRQSKLKNK